MKTASEIGQCPVIAIKTLFVMTKEEEEEELKVIKWIVLERASDKLRWTAVPLQHYSSNQSKPCNSLRK